MRPRRHAYTSTRSVFETFSPVHMKALKQWKYDSMRFMVYEIIPPFSSIRTKTDKPAFSKVSTDSGECFEQVSFRWPSSEDVRGRQAKP